MFKLFKRVIYIAAGSSLPIGIGLGNIIFHTFVHAITFGVALSLFFNYIYIYINKSKSDIELLARTILVNFLALTFFIFYYTYKLN